MPIAPALALFVLVALLTACSEAQPPAHLRIAGADIERGRQLTQAKGCGACHSIDGIPGARGVVGPPLGNFAQRTMLAGRFPNAPRTLIPWLMDPPALIPATGMPNLGLSEQDARDVAAFLYTRGAGAASVYPERIPFRAVGESPAAAARSGQGRSPVERAMDTLAGGER